MDKNANIKTIIKDYMITGVQLGYDVHELLLRAKLIKTYDDVEKIFHELRINNLTVKCYYKELSIDELENIIKKCDGCNKHSLIKSFERKLEGIY